MTLRPAFLNRRDGRCNDITQLLLGSARALDDAVHGAGLDPAVVAVDGAAVADAIHLGPHVAGVTGESAQTLEKNTHLQYA